MDLDELFYDAVDLLKTLVAIPRTSRNETEAADALYNQLSQWQLSPKRHLCNVWCIDPEFDPQRPTLLLNAHIDTVKPTGNWLTDPCTPTLSDDDHDTLFGIGTNDDGASLVSLCAAYRALIDTPRNHNIIFLASAEEEVSGKAGIEAVLPMLPQIDIALVGEPTGMNPAVSERGLMVLDATALGISGHAARNEGVNAIYKAITAIEILKNFSFENVSPTLGPINIAVTQIQAGTQHNVVPDKCTFVVDVRTTDAYTNEETLQLLQQAVEPYCTLTPRSTRLRPSGIDTNHPIVQRLTTIGKTTFGSPTLSDQALMPFTSLKCGPGDSARSHTANEFIRLSEIREAIEIYTLILRNY